MLHIRYLRSSDLYTNSTVSEECKFLTLLVYISCSYKGFFASKQRLGFADKYRKYILVSIHLNKLDFCQNWQKSYFATNRRVKETALGMQCGTISMTRKRQCCRRSLVMLTGGRRKTSWRCIQHSSLFSNTLRSRLLVTLYPNQTPKIT